MTTWTLNIVTPWPNTLASNADLTTLAANMVLAQPGHAANFNVGTQIPAGKSLEIKSITVSIYKPTNANPNVQIRLTNANKKDQEMYDMTNAVDPPPNSYQYVILYSDPITPSDKFTLDISSVLTPIFNLKPYSPDPSHNTCANSGINTKLILGDEHKYCVLFYHHLEQFICLSNSQNFYNLVATVPPPPSTCIGYSGGGGGCNSCGIAWWIWLIIGLVLVVILICIVFSSKKPKMTYRRYSNIKTGY